jgi:hypothetical protein
MNIIRHLKCMVMNNYRFTFIDKSLHLLNMLYGDLNPLTLVTLKNLGT